MQNADEVGNGKAVDLFVQRELKAIADAYEDDFALSHQIHDVGLARERLFPKTDWDYEDVYSKSTVPTIAHEIGQWPVYPIWQELLPKFTGMMRPWNISRHYDTAVRRNALRFTDEYHAASARLNRIIYKEEVESFLRTPSCAERHPQDPLGHRTGTCRVCRRGFASAHGGNDEGEAVADLGQEQLEFLGVSGRREVRMAVGGHCHR